MILKKFSSLASQCLEKFENKNSVDSNTFISLLQKKMALCDYIVLLIANDQIVEDAAKKEYNFQYLMTLTSAWRGIGGINDTVAQKKCLDIIDQIGEIVLKNPTSGGYSLRLREFREKRGDRDRFFLLLSSQDPYGLPTFELLFLCNFWQVEHGFLPIHTAGIIHKGKLFLFSGPSGIGKSTIASISEENGDQVVDEDQVLIHLSEAGGYTADGWGYNVVSCQTPLRAIFRLVQNTEDRLIPLKQYQVARLLLERYNDVLGDAEAVGLLRRSFCLLSGVARQIPGYELHFRKSPDFWKLIDEQFPD